MRLRSWCGELRKEQGVEAETCIRVLGLRQISGWKGSYEKGLGAGAKIREWE